MGRTRLINIGHLYGITEGLSPKIGSDLAIVENIENAYLDFEADRIVGYGKMSDAAGESAETYDVQGGIVYPTYIDCHTHLVYAQNREGEFVDRIKGLTYQEIAQRGGGILNSVEKLRSMSEDELFSEAKTRLDKLIKLGTGAIEIKSGYGLSLDAEVKMLRVVKRLKQTYSIPIKATFLGAHAFPTEFKDKPEAYVDYIIDVMLPAIAQEGLADYIDAFCEVGYFNVEQTKRIVQAGNQVGIHARLHVNQFESFGAIQMAAENNAISVEHLEVLSDADVEVLSNSSMYAVGLPACSFFIKIPYTDARRLIEAKVPFVLASDYNPGSSPTGNLSFVMSLACIYMQMLPSEALNALTVNAACSLGIENEVGSIAVGKKANVIVSQQVKTLSAVPYQFGENVIDAVFINGQLTT